MPGIIRTPLQVRHVQFPGASITWAGEYPWKGGFCFGTEEGGVWIAGIDRYLDLPPVQISASREAINGTAFTRTLMAASTRAEVVVIRPVEPQNPGRAEFGIKGVAYDEFVYEGGAHGIIATEDGRFLTPLGPDGLLQIGVAPEGQFYERGVRAKGIDLYFYKVAHVGISAEGEDVMVVAGRTDGLLVLSQRPDAPGGRITVKRGRSPVDGSEMDFVDACGLASPRHPFAIAGLGIDNSLYLARDPRERDSITLHFPGIRGTAYSAFGAKGHLFIFTSEGLYALPHLATRFLRGDRLDGKTIVQFLEIGASDASLAYENSFLIVDSDGVCVIPIGDLLTGPKAGGNGEIPGSHESQIESVEMTLDVDHSPWESPSEFPLETLVHV